MRVHYLKNEYGLTGKDLNGVAILIKPPSEYSFYYGKFMCDKMNLIKELFGNYETPYVIFLRTPMKIYFVSYITVCVLIWAGFIF